MDKLKQEDKRYHIDTSRKVFVYKNLHKDCWSVRSNKTGQLLGHVQNIHLQHATLVVRPAGRARVLREKRKNVHAGIVGYIDENEMAMTFGTAVTYNPYKYSTFVEKGTEEPVIWRGFASLDHNTVLAA